MFPPEEHSQPGSDIRPKGQGKAVHYHQGVSQCGQGSLHDVKPCLSSELLIWKFNDEATSLIKEESFPGGCPLASAFSSFFPESHAGPIPASRGYLGLYLKKNSCSTPRLAPCLFRAECRPEGRGLKLWLPGLIFRALVSSPTTDLDF